MTSVMRAPMWMQSHDPRVTELLLLAEKHGAYMNDSATFGIRQTVRALTYLEGEESLTDAGVLRLVADLKAQIDERRDILQSFEDSAWELGVAIDKRESKAREIAEYVLTPQGHRTYVLVVGA